MTSGPITSDAVHTPTYAQNHGRSQRPAPTKSSAPMTAANTTPPTMPRRIAGRTTACFILGSEPAPAAADLGVELDALLETIDAAVLVGLVHELQLAGTEDHGRGTAVGGRQRGGIGEVRDATQGRARADNRGGEIVELLAPRMRGIGPAGLEV